MATPHEAVMSEAASIAGTRELAPSGHAPTSHQGLDPSRQERPIRLTVLRAELKALSEVVEPSALIDVLLERAFEMRATDIHLDPQENHFRIRVRVDGMLVDVLQVPLDLGVPMIARLKLMGGMNIAEKRFPQDGHIVYRVGERHGDVRVATALTALGERVVLRLFPDQQVFSSLESLGMTPDQADQVRRFLGAPYGMLLGVGPVGSGKTTTMYTCLQLLDQPTRSLATIEDPIEHRIVGVNQMQVEPHIDLNFAKGLRALLRQDPDVIMVGEIRDAETAHTAVQAGLTGALVLSTLHANDAAGAIDVFHEFGVPTMLLADSLLGIIGQRLLRKVCLECREAYTPNEAVCELLGLDPASPPQLYHGRGCDACFNTGYLGLTGVFEIMPVDTTLRKALLRAASGIEIHESAVQAGMTTLQQSAMCRVREAVTTVEELHRVVVASPSKATESQPSRITAARMTGRRAPSRTRHNRRHVS